LTAVAREAVLHVNILPRFLVASISRNGDGRVGHAKPFRKTWGFSTPTQTEHRKKKTTTQSCGVSLLMTWGFSKLQALDIQAHAMHKSHQT